MVLVTIVAASCALDATGRDFAASVGSAGSSGGPATSSGVSSAGSGGTSNASTGNSTSGAGGAGGAGGTSETGTASGTSGEETGSGGQDAGPPPPTCGDGIKEGDEECDDGNLTPGDRCGPGCAIENPTQCPGTPIALDFGSITIGDNTSGAFNNFNESAQVGSCPYGVWSGNDLVYAVTPLQSGTLKASLLASYTEHFLHIRTKCPGTAQDEIGCDFSSSPANPDVNSVPVTKGTTYYIVPDAYNKAQGPFTLTLELSP